MVCCRTGFLTTYGGLGCSTAWLWHSNAWKTSVAAACVKYEVNNLYGALTYIVGMVSDASC